MSASEDQPLYAPHEPIFPRRVKGKFRTLKWWILAITLGIYYITPFLRWDRGPNLPDQAVLIDMAGRRFYFFWIEIWPHEFYFVAGLLIMAGLGLFLFTSALGRVWCGYTCPQTVWTDLFILVERWIEGDRNARVRLWKADWDARKIRLRVTKWIVWLLISIATGGAWVFYFADAPTLAVTLVTFEAPFIAYSTIGVLTATTFIFGGFMREQVCIYMCPWPRIQAAMMDDDTLTVAYRDWRGEPRGKDNLRRAKAAAATAENAETITAQAGPGAARYKATPYPNKPLNTPAPTPHLNADGIGDCIDCMACVNVCPMGIDIRDGQQMECITCALCIDACDEVMEKIGKDRGLIDYLALSDEGREREGKAPRPIWQHVFRLRTMVYTAIWSLVGIGLVWALFVRSDISLTVEPVRNPQFVTLSDGSVRNTYTLRIRNLTGEDREFRVLLDSDDILRIGVEESSGIPNHVIVPANETLSVRTYVTARPQDPASTRDRTDLSLWVEDVLTDERAGEDTVFNGKGS
ncbi:cytochrome c oxidase accessory protein CcoG [Boseongicola aestuarii]|uniref:Ubp3 associated protein Bre5 n=1 Tax=Boseongicola aestuarii TaxID=1470561 RepID=A0A238J2J9_9RHOB|nr:cytochrome c oxidase accessory protein CcoG [Boseongicola aestuarii]SMX24124.1 Ubp3 associated protein Bre5 [Boseongicola aestuarii]